MTKPESHGLNTLLRELREANPNVTVAELCHAVPKNKRHGASFEALHARFRRIDIDRVFNAGVVKEEKPKGFFRRVIAKFVPQSFSTYE